MILYYKTKILISGIFPMVNFKIDGFIEKTGQYNEKIIDIENMEEDTGFACPDSKYSTLLHECIHWSDAENYRQNHGQITNENYGTEYLPKLRKQCKKSLDRLIKKGYNISSISDYAMKEFEKGHFDETYTEYRVTKMSER